MTNAASAVERFAAWLADVLPFDYYERYDAYKRDMAFRRSYHRLAFEAGWLMPEWPAELGGRELDSASAVAVEIEAARRTAPRIPNAQGARIIAPAIREWGLAEQRERYLPPTMRGDAWWALGMSEPDAGSDLASLRTRADRRGGAYVLNGSKIWTTQAHESRWCMVYCRTEPEGSKHGGISCLLVDLDSAGVTVRVVERAWPTFEEFCEVFFEDVEVPAENLLGREGDGWRIARSALTYERTLLWTWNLVDLEQGLRRAAREARTCDLEAVGQLVCDATAIAALGTAYSTDESGRDKYVPSVLKLLGAEGVQRAWHVAMAAVGPAALVDGELLAENFDAYGTTIYGGASEIHRNIVAKHVLGLGA